jgi:myo-inositol-1(or 4)-monophosphatase
LERLMESMTRLTRSTIAIAVDAGRLALRGLGDHPPSRPKGRFDLQLDADVDSEKEIVPRLRSLLPGSEVASEEMGGPVDWSNSNVWIVDPLDGTNNYYSAIPYLAISIALRQHCKLVLAVVYDPVLCHSFSARLGGGAEQDGHTLKGRPGKPLDRATVSLITNYSQAGRRAGEALYLKLNSVARRVTTLWAPAADLVRAATGHIDGVVCVNAMYGDVCSGLLILAEAGGTILDCNGADIDVATLDPTEPISFVASISEHTANDLLVKIMPELENSI